MIPTQTTLRIVLATALLSYSTLLAAEPAQWVTGEMTSDLVPTSEYGAILPPDYSGEETYPLILLLHGGGGDRNFGKQMQPLVEAAWKAGELPPAVVVTPTANRSFYVDFRDGSQKWESFIVSELIPHIRKEFSVSTARAKTVVTGISMGGMGSLRLALRHPDVFSAVAAVEPAIEAGATWSQLNQVDKFYRRGGVVEEKFGDPIDEEYWAANHPISIALASSEQLKKSGLAIYFEVGERDMLYLHRGSEYLHRVLYDRGISHEFRYVRGADHVGPSIQPRMADAIRFIGKALNGYKGDPVPVAMTQRHASTKAEHASDFANPRKLPPIPTQIGNSSGMTNITISRFESNPLVSPHAGPGIGNNINGPSLIRVPDWLPNPLGKYYLYFADHKGPDIRLAYADDVRGPWKIYDPGTLQLAQSHFLTEAAEITPEAQARIDAGDFSPHNIEGVPQPLDSATKPHIASPDVHVRNDRKEIVMYYHGLQSFRRQTTRVATSKDGINFEAREPELARPYMRAFEHNGMWYGMAMPGVFYRSKDGLADFEKGPTLFPTTMRHAAILKRDATLYIFWSNVGDTPEHILLSNVDVSGDWNDWKASDPVSVMYPETRYEGADQPLIASVRDAMNVRVNQLRDPAVFEDGGKTYLLYSIAGEAGIAGAEIVFD